MGRDVRTGSYKKQVRNIAQEAVGRIRVDFGFGDKAITRRTLNMHSRTKELEKVLQLPNNTAKEKKEWIAMR